VPALRALGFDGLELAWPSRQIDLLQLSGSGRRELLHLFGAHGMRLTSLRADVGTAGFAPGADVDRTLDKIDQILNVAAGLATPVVCIDLGRLPPAQRVARPKPKITREMAGLLILPETTAATEPEPEPITTRVDPAMTNHWQQVLGHLGEISDRYGAMLALSSTLSSLAALSTALKQTSCPWFGVDFDTTAPLRDEWSIDETFDELGPLIRHVRARDAIKGEDRRTKPAIVGRGDVAWRDVFQLLDDAGYHGPVTIDPTDLADPRPAAVAGLKQLRAYLET
jgi:sugar phosphate isomerase/epimerase